MYSMFKDTRRRLVILNTVVFLIILCLLSSLFYWHMKSRLFHETDEILHQAEKRIHSYRNLNDLLRSDRADLQKDERTVYLFWDAQGQLVGQSPKQAFSGELADQLRAPSDSAAVRTVRVDQRSYRAMQFTVQSQSHSSIASVEIVRSLEDLQHTLRSLLWDIGAGMVVGAVISAFAGLFLAGRALIPIQQAWEKQQRFVADASHELRTPTAVIHAQTELLLRYPNHSIEQESSHIVVILKESKRMSKLLDDLLTLARSDSNQLEISSSQISLDALIEELSERFELLASTKDIHIVNDVIQPLTLWGDEGRIRQLLIILLDNALKNTPPSGTIEISGRYQGNFVCIRVKDNGVGIAAEDLPHIFDRFYRGDKARSRAEGGTGLGLSIAKWIVNVHGGVIRVESAIHAGTQIELLFPRKK
ncbi:Alkaline phosphatase synthesis sensor protein PhoR [Paenibacillus konkukensis]|uniref:histidine kinase n=1 Tax=Paenibacillus konkukensis TaxID=2020716 RepID=A0ABY4RHA9_9BACL|nr:Alkaline phosphatase synthesis sensor protein PhoR [Paenibacillus konkukensis]